MLIILALMKVKDVGVGSYFGLHCKSIVQLVKCLPRMREASGPIPNTQTGHPSISVGRMFISSRLSLAIQ